MTPSRRCSQQQQRYDNLRQKESPALREQSWDHRAADICGDHRAGQFDTTGSQNGNCVAIDALEPIAEELERIGGSRAQLEWRSSRC
jgi:hypothetical protein